MTISSLFVTLFTLSTATAAPLMPGAARPAGSDNSLVEKVAEGFSSDRDAAPEAVKRAWNSTYILISEKTLNKGTAFVVGSTNMGEITRLYFLTNWHVIKSQCADNGRCSDSVLARNVKIVNSGSKIASFDVKLHFLKVVRVSQKLDLALVAADVNPNSSLPVPIKIASNCGLQAGEPVYTVGFSNIIRRKGAVVGVSDSEAGIIQKRWSLGLFVSYGHASDLGVDVGITKTSVDLINGGSGGALLNASGEAIGVLRYSMATSKNNYQYDGNEDAGHLDWHSHAVRCEYLADFINGGVEIALQR